MANKLLIKRGTRAKLPALGVGEPAFCTDTKELFVGSATGNVQYPNKDEVDRWLGERVTLGVRTQIPQGANLNNYKTVGCFTVKSDTDAKKIINSPFSSAFILDVGMATGMSADSYIAQTATNSYARVTKSRLWVPEESTWHEWQLTTNYESGTWPISIYGATVEGNPAYRVREGRWEKIGNKIFLYGHIELTALGGMSGPLRIKGLPEPVKNTIKNISCYGFGFKAEFATLRLMANVTSHGFIELNYGDLSGALDNAHSENFGNSGNYYVTINVDYEVQE